MNVTHNLRWYARDNDCHNGDCLCSKETAISIIYSVLIANKNQRFFFHFNSLDGTEEIINGFAKEGNCYYLE